MSNNRHIQLRQHVHPDSYNDNPNSSSSSLHICNFPRPVRFMAAETHPLECLAHDLHCRRPLLLSLYRLVNCNFWWTILCSDTYFHYYQRDNSAVVPD